MSAPRITRITRNTIIIGQEGETMIIVPKNTSTVVIAVMTETKITATIIETIEIVTTGEENHSTDPITINHIVTTNAHLPTKLLRTSHPRTPTVRK